MAFGKTYSGNKVPRLTKFLYPFSGIFRDACYALVGSFLVQYAMNSGVLNTDPNVAATQFGIITIAMMVALVWDGINDPIMGFIVEKVHFKLGKFKPWILIGAIGNVIAVACMFLIRPGNPADPGYGWAFVGIMIVFYFLWDLFFTMNDIGYWSMLPSLTTDEKERATLTSRVSICASIGGFIMTAAGMLLPNMFIGFGVSYPTVWAILSIVVSVLFLGSQVAVFFLCQERERDVKQEEASEKSSLLDLFKVFGKNKELRVVVIAMFLYYLASGVLTGGIGLNYFYLSIGYGSGRGGLVSTIISVMYVLGMVGSQALYPVLAKKLKKQTILTIFFVVMLAAFAGFLLCCFPLFGDHAIAWYPGELAAIDSMDFGFAFGGTMFLYYLFPLIFFFAMGMLYMVILVMFQDAIDYNEWKFGERKESLISSWRPLTVKLGSALLRGFQYLIFISAGVYAIVTNISNTEQAYNLHQITKETYYERMATYTADAPALRIMGIWIVAILAVSMLIAFLLLHFGYHVDEEKHREIVADLERLHASNGEKPALASEPEMPIAPEVGLGVGQEPSQVIEDDKPDQE